MILKFLLALLVANFNTVANSDQPIVYIEKYKALFGNQIYEFCAGKILSEKLGIPLQCPPIFGFPETYSYSNKLFNKNLPFVTVNQKNLVQTINSIKTDSKSTNFILDGAMLPFQHWQAHNKEQIKQWLKFETPLNFQKNPNDIVLHIRIYKTQNKNYRKLLPLSFYDQVLSSTTYDRIYICTNEPNHPYIQNFKKYNPIIKSTASLHEMLYEKDLDYESIIRMNFDEFRFIASFNKIVVALSTLFRGGFFTRLDLCASGQTLADGQMAPRDGFEPPTNGLTVRRSTTELPGKIGR